MEETKVIYHIDDEETPYLVKIPISPDKVTLADFKNVLNRPNYKFFFKSMDDDFGFVISTVRKMPRRFTENEQVLILNLIRYFELEKAAGGPLLPVTAINNRVSEALGISLSTVNKIRTKGVEKDEEYKTATKTAIVASRGRPCYTVSEHIIRGRVYAMYAAGEHVTLRSLKTNLHSIDGVDISINSLWKGLKEWKFKWRSCSISNRKYLMEQPDISYKRLKFLREFKNNETSPFCLKPVFLDETWFYSKGGFRKSWQDDTLQTVRKKTGEGVRYIVLHAGSEDGFVDNASLVFKAGSKSGDYHDSMNCANFDKWFEEQLLINLKEPSLIIMDNAPYHCGLVEKIPNQSWTKTCLIEWLKLRNIPFPTLAMKDEIWNLVKKLIPARKYRLDELALQYGHRVLRLPPYHCQFNPIEMVWSEAKRYYDAHIGLVKLVSADSVLNLWNEALGKITPDKWKSYVHRTNCLITESWEREQFIDASDILPVIIDLNDSDEESENECFSDDENI